MNEDKQQELDQARRDLDQAREAHTAAVVARLEAPNDPDTSQRVKDAVQQGKQAWKGYRHAATAGLAAQIDALQPGAFPDVPTAFREE